MALNVRWHSRAGQGAVTGAKALAEVMSQQGNMFKHIQYMEQKKEVLQ